MLSAPEEATAPKQNPALLETKNFKDAATRSISRNTTYPAPASPGIPILAKGDKIMPIPLILFEAMCKIYPESLLRLFYIPVSAVPGLCGRS